MKDILRGCNFELVNGVNYYEHSYVVKLENDAKTLEQKLAEAETLLKAYLMQSEAAEKYVSELEQKLADAEFLVSSYQKGSRTAVEMSCKSHKILSEKLAEAEAATLHNAMSFISAESKLTVAVGLLSSFKNILDTRGSIQAGGMAHNELLELLDAINGVGDGEKITCKHCGTDFVRERERDQHEPNCYIIK